jgi:hypothetical protein
MNAITPERHQELKARIEPLREQVESWCKNKTGNQLMPETLWEGAVELAKLYGVALVDPRSGSLTVATKLGRPEINFTLTSEGAKMFCRGGFAV